MRFLVCGDLHLKPAASDYDLDAVVVPDDVDAALILGDLTHRAGPDDITLARRFVERIQSEVPVVYVPGNHDPAPTEEQVVESLTGARSGHRTVHDFGGLTLIGWGCENRTLSIPVDQTKFEALDPRRSTRRDRRYLADEAAGEIETACSSVICGGTDPSEVARTLGIRDANVRAFKGGLEEILSTYTELTELLRSRDDILLATHVPPFNTSFDRHHAVGSREVDQEYLHVGSIALKLAIQEHDVFASISGHSHTHGFESGDGSDDRPYYLNFGYRGIGTINVVPEEGRFSYTRMTKDRE